MESSRSVLFYKILDSRVSLIPSLFSNRTLRLTLAIAEEIDENGLKIPESDQEWEELPPGDWRHACREFLKALSTVGRDAVYSMSKYVETATRISIAYEPGYVKDLNETTAFAPQLAEALLASFKEEGLYATPLKGRIATDEDIDKCLDSYSKQSLRFGWSLPVHRGKMKSLLRKIGIEKGELERWEAMWKNKMVSFLHLCGI